MEQLDKLDIQRIRKFNTEVNEQKKNASDLIARMEFNKNELNRICQELTVELGVQVTPENIEEVYKQCVAKINNSLEAGEEILNRIKNNEQVSQANTSNTQSFINTNEMEQRDKDRVYSGIKTEEFSNKSSYDNYTPGIGLTDGEDIDFSNIPKMF